MNVVKIEDFEKGRIGKQDRLVITVVALRNQELVTQGAGHRFNIRELRFDDRTDR